MKILIQKNKFLTYILVGVLIICCLCTLITSAVGIFWFVYERNTELDVNLTTSEITVIKELTKDSSSKIDFNIDVIVKGNKSDDYKVIILDSNLRQIYIKDISLKKNEELKLNEYVEARISKINMINLQILDSSSNIIFEKEFTPNIKELSLSEINPSDYIKISVDNMPENVYMYNDTYSQAQYNRKDLISGYLDVSYTIENKFEYFDIENAEVEIKMFDKVTNTEIKLPDLFSIDYIDLLEKNSVSDEYFTHSFKNYKISYEYVNGQYKDSIEMLDFTFDESKEYYLEITFLGWEEHEFKTSIKTDSFKFDLSDNYYE